MIRPNDIRLTLYLLIIALYAAARFWRLDASCLWFDEMFSVQAAEQAWSGLLRFVALDLVHPPLFYILLKLWIGIGGESVFWLRSLPVLFACLSIIPFILITREMGRGREDKWWAPLGLFLIAVNGSLIKYAQEVRMYTMLMLLSLISIWLFARYFYRGKSWLWLVGINILLVYTHYYGWLVIGCEVVAIVAFQRMKWRRIVGMGGIVLAAFLPWVLAILSAARSSDLGQNIAWIERPGVRTLFEFILKQIEPFYFQSSSIETTSVFLVSVPLLILILIVVTFRLAMPANDSDEKRSTRLLLVFALVPLVLAVTASWVLPYSVWGTRHLIVISGPVAMLIAAAVVRLPLPVIRTAAITLLILFSGYAAYIQLNRESPNHVWCGWERLIADVPAEEDSTLNIYSNENLIAYHAWFATRHSAGYQVGVVKGLDNVENRTYFLPRGFDDVRKITVDDIGESHILLLYRIEKPVLDDQLFKDLKTRGYTACPPRIVEYGPSTAFRVEMTREPGACIYPF